MIREFDFYLGSSLIQTYGESEFMGEGIVRSPIQSTCASLKYNKSGTPIVNCPKFEVLYEFKISLALSSGRHSALVALVLEHQRRIREGNQQPAFLTIRDRSRHLIEPTPRTRTGENLQATTNPNILKYYADFTVLVRMIDAWEVLGGKGSGAYWRVELEAFEIAPPALETFTPLFTLDTTGFN
jgi:hypothetical protein